MYTEITTEEAAFQAQKLDINVLPGVAGIPESLGNAIINHYKQMVVTAAINEGWEPDWSNSSERKYYPWWWVKSEEGNKSGSGLSFGDVVCAGSAAVVGSRLVFQSRERMMHAVKHFTYLYEKTHLIR